MKGKGYMEEEPKITPETIRKLKKKLKKRRAEYLTLGQRYPDMFGGGIEEYMEYIRGISKEEFDALEDHLEGQL